MNDERAADAERKRIEALANDPEACALAAFAHPRMPSADLQDDEAGKAANLARLRRLGEAAAADPERAARIAAADRRAAADPVPAEAGNPAKSATGRRTRRPGGTSTPARHGGRADGAPRRRRWKRKADPFPAPTFTLADAETALAAMAAWLPKCPDAARAECAELLAAVLAPDLETACRLTGYNPDIIRALEWPPACEWTADGDALLARVTWTGGGPASDRSWTLQPRVTMRADLDLVTVHAQWRTGPARPHPAAPLLRAWQRRPTPADPFVPAKRASLPRLTPLGRR